jgi:hypothetical protein
MLTVTRRGLLVLGGTGAAGAVLAGCSEATEPRDEADAQSLAQAEAEAEQNLSRAYLLASRATTGEQSAALERFGAAAKKRSAEVAGGDFENTTPEADGGPDAPEALSACQHLANVAIAAHLEAAGLLDTVEGRALASSSLAACAAELAAVNGFAGDPEAPSAFVTGGPQKPLESFDDPDSDDADESSTTSTTSTSTTETTGEE